MEEGEHGRRVEILERLDGERGTTRNRLLLIPLTDRASSSSRTLRAPRSAVMAVPATAATISPVATGANSRTLESTMKPPMRYSADTILKKEPASRATI